MHELAAKNIPNERKLIPKPEALELYRKSEPGIQMRAGRGKSHRADGFLLHHRQIHRLLPRAAHPLHRPHQGVQADERRRRLLERPGRQSADAADLRRLLRRQKDLDEYLHKLEEAKRRDHRKLGQELDLFSIQDEAGPGLIFWHPKGGSIRKQMEDWLRDELLRRGYDLVFTPHIMRLDLWKTSGHAEFLSREHVRPDRSRERPITSSSP